MEGEALRSDLATQAQKPTVSCRRYGARTVFRGLDCYKHAAPRELCMFETRFCENSEKQKLASK